MALKSRRHYSGFMNASQLQKIQNVKIPSNIKCSICGRIKGFTGFSKTQQQILQLRIANHALTADEAKIYGMVPCLECNTTQKEEIECAQCEKVKPLDDFAKAQRKEGDAARCKDCMKRQVAEPAVEASVSPSVDGGDGDGGDDEDSDGGTTLTNGMSTMSASSKPRDGRLVRRTASEAFARTSSTASASASKFDSGMFGNFRRGTRSNTDASTASSAAWHDAKPCVFDPKKYGQTTLGRQENRPLQPKLGKSGWAKVPAYTEDAPEDYPVSEDDVESRVRKPARAAQTLDYDDDEEY